MAYFIRRSGDDCAVIALHPGDGEGVIASGLSIGDAEDLCVGKNRGDAETRNAAVAQA
jgi:hypothetical protein